MSAKAADTFARLCAENEQIPDVFEFLEGQLELNDRDKLEVLLVDQYQRWKHQQAIPVDNYLARTPEIRDIDKVELLVEEFGYLEQRGVAPDAAAFVNRFKSLEPAAFEELCEALDVEPTTSSSGNSSTPDLFSECATPKSVGRYEFVRAIGKGSFGEVFLARDPELQRSVAIKVPTRQRIEMGGGTNEFLEEARTVAKLDHPNIVPVYDCGQTDDGLCYVVSKYIKGKQLRAEIRKGMPQFEAARIVAIIARALHVAHRNGLVHRDVKPGNILLDCDRQPHLLDFGLALREQDHWNTESLVGTPAYMSPEQAAGGDQSIDGRSDIYSLGVVLYEMLTGRRPVNSNLAEEVLKQISLGEVRPPRQHNDVIMPELERICMKALALKLTDRYSTAKDFADELDAFLSDNDQPISNADSASGKSWKRNSLDSKTNRHWTGLIVAALLVVSLVTWIDWPKLLTMVMNDRSKASTSSLDELRPSQQPNVEFEPSNSSLAVLVFRNVAGDEKSDWIGFALAELFSIELDKSEDLKVVARESVSLLESDLQLYQTDVLGPATLEKVHQRIGSNLIVTGAFAPAGVDLERLRLELKLQDTSSGEVVSSYQEVLDYGDLEHFVRQAASQIRADLRLMPLDLMVTGQINLGFPANPNAARHYFNGVAEMRNFDLTAAREQLETAAELESASAVIQDALAQVYTNLGNENLARKYSRRAVELAVNLPVSQSWNITARNHLLEGRPVQAVAVYRELFKRNKRSILDGIAQASAMVKSGQGWAALELIREIRSTSRHPSELARIEIVAAQAAESVSAFQQQIEFANRAIECAELAFSPLLQAQALYLQGRAMHRLGDREAVKKLMQSFELFEQNKDRHGAAMAIGTIGKTYIDVGDFETADEKTVQAIEISSKIGNERLFNSFQGQLGELLIYRGKYEEATAKLQESKAKFDQLGDRINSAGIGLTLANLMARRGRSEDAHELIRDARKAFQSSGNRQAEARTWGQQGAMYGRAGDSDQAHSHFERALELFREVGDRRSEATCLGDLALTFSVKGDFQKAGKLLSQSLEMQRQVGSRSGLSRVTYNLGLLYIRTGRARDALPLLQESFESFRNRGNIMDACFVQRKLGDLQIAFGDLKLARQTLEEALETARSAGSKKSVEASALAALSQIELYGGEFEKARELLVQSREIRKEIKQDENVAVSNLALAQIAIREVQLDAAAELLRKTKDVLKLNSPNWDWICRATTAQVDVLKSGQKDSVGRNNAKVILKEFKEYLHNDDSQDVNMRVALLLSYARLLAAFEESAAVEVYEDVVSDANNQGLLATELTAVVESFELQASRMATLDRDEVNKYLEICQQRGFIDFAKRLKAIR